MTTARFPPDSPTAAGDEHAHFLSSLFSGLSTYPPPPSNLVTHDYGIYIYISAGRCRPRRHGFPQRKRATEASYALDSLVASPVFDPKPTG